MIFQFTLFLWLLCTLVLAINHGNARISHISGSLDENDQLFSRQVLVYGAAGQRRLLSSKVLVLGSGPTTLEITKNLALAGVRSIILVRNDRFSLQLQSYLQSLNLHTKISINENADNILFGDKDIDLVLCADMSLSDCSRWNAVARQAGVPFLGCNVRGVCGYIFEDLLDVYTSQEHLESPLKEYLIENIEVLSNDDSKRIVFRLKVAQGATLSDIGDRDTMELFWMDGRTSVRHNTTCLVDRKLDRSSLECSLSASSLSVDSLVLAVDNRMSYARRVPSVFTCGHRPLSAVLREPAFEKNNDCAARKSDLRLNQIILYAMSELEKEHTDFMAFSEAVCRAVRDHGGDISDDHFVRSFMQKVWSSRFGKCPSVVSLAGALAAQEILKAIMHMGTPVCQLRMVEAVESVSDTEASLDRHSVSANEHADILAPQPIESVYGAAVKRELAQMRVLVVGAGAIGCELLKLLSQLGVGSAQADQPNKLSAVYQSIRSLFNSTLFRLTGQFLIRPTEPRQRGSVTVVDMDAIERSNLNRQLLFRSADVGKYKALAAAETISLHNPSMHIYGLASKMSTEFESSSESLVATADVVLLAVDNLDARQYVDSLCVKYRKWLIDAGTLGLRGSTQVVVPGESESYSSSSDPPEESIPICTIKSFPSTSEHCISWARLLFTKLFSDDVNEVRRLLELVQQEPHTYHDEEGIATAVSQLDLQSEELVDLLSFVSLLVNDSVEGCILWSISKFDDLFCRGIELDLAMHPADELNEDGTQFWSGYRKAPHPISFNSSISHHVELVAALSRLRLQTLGQFVPTAETMSLKVASLVDNPSVLQEYLSKHKGIVNSTARVLTQLIAKALHTNVELLSKHTLIALIYDKDDLDSGHNTFMSAASKTRCCNFNLESVDELQVRRVAGNIVPAVATTTAAVAGLVGIELIKIAGDGSSSRRASVGLEDRASKKWWSWSRWFRSTVKSSALPSDTKRAALTGDRWTFSNWLFEFVRFGSVNRLPRIARFRNTFLDLAKCTVTSSTPVAAEQLSAPTGELYSIWDAIQVFDEDGSISVSAITGALKQRFNVDVTSIVWEEKLLYCDGITDEAEASAPIRLSCCRHVSMNPPLSVSLTIHGTLSDSSEIAVPTVRINWP